MLNRHPYVMVKHPVNETNINFPAKGDSYESLLTNKSRQSIWGGRKKIQMVRDGVGGNRSRMRAYLMEHNAKERTVQSKGRKSAAHFRSM